GIDPPSIGGPQSDRGPQGSALRDAQSNRGPQGPALQEDQSNRGPQGSALREDNDLRVGRAFTARHQWPTRSEVRAFVEEADSRVRRALMSGDLDRAGHPLLDRSEAVFAVLEHEAMHQETLLYMWHRLPFDQKRRRADYRPQVEGTVPVQEWIDVPAGRATLGVDARDARFTWDNERPHRVEDVAAFAI